jgi:hypothetical protein
MRDDNPVASFISAKEAQRIFCFQTYKEFTCFLKRRRVQTKNPSRQRKTVSVEEVIRGISEEWPNGRWPVWSKKFARAEKQLAKIRKGLRRRHIRIKDLFNPKVPMGVKDPQFQRVKQEVDLAEAFLRKHRLLKEFLEVLKHPNEPDFKALVSSKFLD